METASSHSLAARNPGPHWAAERYEAGSGAEPQGLDRQGGTPVARPGFPVEEARRLNSSGGNATVILASLADSITAGTLNVGNVASGVPGVGPTSTLVLGANTTLDVNNINVGTSGSRAGGHLNAGSGILTIAGATGGSSTANLLIGKNDSYEAADIENSVFDTSGGTLNASFGTMTIGEANPTGSQTGNRGVTVNATMNMGAGTLTASRLNLGTILSATGNTGAYYYQELVTGSFNLTGGTATIPTIIFGNSGYTGNFNSTYGSVINADVVLNSGATLNTTTMAPGTFNTPNQGTITLNPTIVWNSGTIANIAGNGLSITGINLNVSSGTGSQAFNISSGQTGTIASVISGTGGINMVGTGTLLLSSTNSYTGGTNVSGGTLILASTNAYPLNTSLTVAAGAQLIINNSTGAIFMPQISSLANSGTVDITNNGLIVHNGSIGTITAEVDAAFNNGAWNGNSSSGASITSSIAQSNTTHLTAVGVATGLTTFEGSTVAPTDVLIKYTYYGDANLDGKVDGSDYSLIDNGYLNNLTGWYNGDFNYDGVVNGSDYTLIDNAFNSQGTQISAELASPSAIATAQIAVRSAAVPEPTSLSLLSLAVATLLGRRRRRI